MPVDRKSLLSSVARPEVIWSDTWALRGLDSPIGESFSLTQWRFDRSDTRLPGLSDNFTRLAGPTTYKSLESSAAPEFATPNPAEARTTNNPLKAIDWGSKVSKSTIDVYFAPKGKVIEGEKSLGWSAFEKQQMMLAFKQVESVTDLDFRKTDRARDAEFRLLTGDYINEFDALAWMFPPGEQFAGIGGFDKNFLRWIDFDTENSLFERGGYGFAVMLEEIGHGLGLAHPHDTGGASQKLAGVDGVIGAGSYGVGELNQGVFTVMGYNEGWPAGPNGDKYLDEKEQLILLNDFGYEAGMSALDIAVLQEKYGANEAKASGDSTYRLPEKNGLGTFFRCIWDVGGKDTISYEGDRDATIDLRPATLDGERGGGGYMSWAKNIRGGFTIANGVTIENASGGKGDDLLVGNSKANKLQGGKGRDQLLGKNGDDKLDGGDGRDDMRGGRGDDTYVVNRSDDIVVENERSGRDKVLSSIKHRLGKNVEDLRLTGVRDIDGFGNDRKNKLTGNDGDNVLEGAANNDTLHGKDGDDKLDGGDGRDDMRGGRGDDIYVVDHSDDIVVENERSGRDKVLSSVKHRLAENVEDLRLTGGRDIDGFGNDRKNKLTGNDGDNVLEGAANNDTLHGKDGDDKLDGGEGRDDMRGGRGDDIYVVDHSDDIVVEDANRGEDTVRSAASFRLPDHVEDLVLTGSAAVDAIGNTLDNALQGNDADNRLTGGLGSDRLDGGLGADFFVFTAADESRPGGAGDVIVSLESGTDKIDLSAIDANNTIEGDQPFVFVGTAAFSGTAGELRYADGLVAGDTSGDAEADFEITIEDLSLLVSSDFIL